jgi:aspartate aminotransferase
LTARLAYVDFDGARALAASENVALDRDLPADFADRWCDQIIAGKQRIASWLSDMTRTDADST